MMEIYEFDDESLDDFISIKIIGIGASGARLLIISAMPGMTFFLRD